MKKTAKKDSPDLMGALNKRKTADTIATELENEAKRFLHSAMLLRGKDKMQVRVAKKK